MKVFFSLTFFLVPCVVFAATIDSSLLVPKVTISLEPRVGTFIEGSTFDVPIYINTKGSSVNAVEVRVSFDSDYLLVVRPSGGASVVGLWAEPPAFDNEAGTVRYVGVIPNGITTEAGLLGSITFRAKRPGTASVRIESTSNVFLNDGVGSPAEVETVRASYTIAAKPPEGVSVFSETHPVSGDWYNNNSPIISWDTAPGIEGFSVVLDTFPTTIPQSQVSTTVTTQAFDGLHDGVWYAHVRALRGGVWGAATHHTIRIDTTPPASFTPTINYLLASTIVVERALVSFFTTDALSGIDRFEVGVIDKAEGTSVSPVFVEATSPFQVPLSGSGNLEVIVRAIDNAGNIRDESITIRRPGIVQFATSPIGMAAIGSVILLGCAVYVLLYRLRRRMP